MPAPNGYVLWRGKSRLDRKSPVVAVVTGCANKTTNRKTGAMLQTWILRTDVEPHTAVKTGQDRAVCGDCPFAGGHGCYVTVFQAPLAVFRAYHRGIYPDGNARDIGAGRSVRIGSYGDPAAVPFSVWDRLTAKAVHWTGYTHQWRRPVARRLHSLCMASCETSADVARAHRAGWRTFRVSAGVDPVPGVEILCPAAKESRAAATCASCGLCQGSTRTARSVIIPAHGATAGRARLAIGGAS